MEAEDLGNACFVFGDISNELSFSINPLPEANSVVRNSCSSGNTIGTSFDLDKFADEVKDNPNSSVRWYNDSAGTTPISATSSYLTSASSTTIYAKINNGICDSRAVPIILNVGDCSTTLEFSIEIGEALDLSDITGVNKEVYITNRWGDLVYASTNYEGTDDKFFGTNLPQGAYYILSLIHI